MLINVNRVIIMFIGKYSFLAFSMILACSQAATEQEQIEAAIAASKAEYEAKLKPKEDMELQKAQLRSKKMHDDSMALQRAIEEQEIQAALQDDLKTRSSKAAAGYHENDDPELQRALALSMQKSAATDYPEEEMDEEMRAAIELSMQKSAVAAPYPAAAGHNEEEMDEETRAAIELSMQEPAAVASARTTDDIAREARLQQFAPRAFADRAPLSEADLEARVKSEFEKDKRAIEIQIHALEEIDVNKAVTIAKDRPKRRGEINARLFELRNQLQDYTVPGKITAKKMQIKTYIAAQR